MDFPSIRHLRQLQGPILLTGHTGFKGVWMTLLLEEMGIRVVGFSHPPQKSSLFERMSRTGAITEIFADIRDYDELNKFIDAERPSAVIHMAAQPLVLESYNKPRETFEVNVMGTVNLLSCAFDKDFIKSIIVVTTDKVYRNNNSGHSFIETDPLEGRDPYSSSKVGTESAISSWQQIAKVSGGPKVVSVRAGNVIGGGDFASNRIIPDLIRGYLSDTPAVIRNPNSSRPWQHVLDPIYGYILALEATLNDLEIVRVNFGPTSKSLPVSEIMKVAQETLGIEAVTVVDTQNEFLQIQSESKSLDLDSSYANKYLSWSPCWDQKSAIVATFEWWKNVLNLKCSPQEATKNDINKLAKFVRDK